jgi:hypothetical protein
MVSNGDDLTGEICHRLLVRIYPNNNKLKFALWAMCNMKSKRQSRYIPLEFMNLLK